MLKENNQRNQSVKGVAGESSEMWQSYLERKIYKLASRYQR
jgi:hypothetical protein